MNLTWQAVIPKPVDPLVILQEVENDLRAIVGPEVALEFDNYVAEHDWVIPITFITDHGRTDDETWVYVYPAPGYGQQVWLWVTNGTPRHDITPKKPGGALAFNWGGAGSYKPKTAPFKTPLRLFGGVTAKELRVFKKVDHPGIEPRLIEEDIGDGYAPRFEEVMKAALNRGYRKAAAG